MSGNDQKAEIRYLAGSYDVDPLQKEATEIDRLRKQAQSLHRFEGSVLRDSGLASTHRVLEVGCGPGFLTPLLCQMAIDGSVTACDTNPDLLAICRSQNLTAPKGGLHTALSEADSIPVANGSQDFAYLRFVLQHAPARQAVLREVLRSLDVYGIVCVLDSDDGLVIQHPEDIFVTNLLKEAQQKQSEKGGDRFIGRKAGALLAEAGFVDVKTRVISFTAADLPFPLLARILLGFKSDLCGRAEETGAWIRQMERKVERGEYFLSGGVVLTTGRKGKD